MKSPDVQTFRLIFLGTRQVVAVNLLSVVRFLSQLRPAAQTSLRDAYDWLKKGTAESFKMYLDASVDHDIFCGSVGPQDMLYLPAGFMFYERILRADVSGIRCIMASLEDVAELEAINQHLISVKKPPPKLQGILDQLVLLEAS